MEFHHPKRIGDAVGLLGRQSSLAVAGATSFVRPSRVAHLVDITGLGLDYIRADKKSVRIGATTTIAELEKSEVVNGLASGILRSACSGMADTPLRNMITVGGDVVCKFPWANLPPALLALGAELSIVGRKKREVSMDKFMGSRLGRGEIVKEVVIPRNLKGRGSYIKFAKTKTDYSMITVAVYLERDEWMVTLARVAVGGLYRPRRLKIFEKGLVGKPPDEAAVNDAIKIHVPNLAIPKTIFTSEDYSREVLGVLLRRALLEALR